MMKPVPNQVYYIALVDDHDRAVYFTVKPKWHESFTRMKHRITRISRKFGGISYWRFATRYERGLIAGGEVFCGKLV